MCVHACVRPKFLAACLKAAWYWDGRKCTWCLLCFSIAQSLGDQCHGITAWARAFAQAFSICQAQVKKNALRHANLMHAWLKMAFPKFSQAHSVALRCCCCLNCIGFCCFFSGDHLQMELAVYGPLCKNNSIVAQALNRAAPPAYYSGIAEVCAFRPRGTSGPVRTLM